VTKEKDQSQIPVPNLPIHDHKPKQHRDGKPPWCPECKLTADFTVPKSIFENKWGGRQVIIVDEAQRMNTKNLPEIPPQMSFTKTFRNQNEFTD
jgi:hypothetical protein